MNSRFATWNYSPTQIQKALDMARRFDELARTRGRGFHLAAVPQMHHAEMGELLIALAITNSPHLRDVLLFLQFAIPRAIHDFLTTREDVADLFHHAGFRPPADLPETVTIWRGGTAHSLDALRRGFSWTTERAAAAIYATHWAVYGGPGEPMVIKAEVPRSDVVAVISRCESETILRRTPPAAEIDGTLAEWRELAADHLPAIWERRRRMMRDGTMPDAQVAGLALYYALDPSMAPP